MTVITKYLPHATVVVARQCQGPGATNSSFRGRVNYHELSFDGVIVLIQPWYNFFANGHI